MAYVLPFFDANNVKQRDAAKQRDAMQRSSSAMLGEHLQLQDRRKPDKSEDAKEWRIRPHVEARWKTGQLLIARTMRRAGPAERFQVGPNCGPRDTGTMFLAKVSWRRTAGELLKMFWRSLDGDSIRSNAKRCDAVTKQSSNRAGSRQSLLKLMNTRPGKVERAAGPTADINPCFNAERGQKCPIKRRKKSWIDQSAPRNAEGGKSNQRVAAAGRRSPKRQWPDTLKRGITRSEQLRLQDNY